MKAKCYRLFLPLLLTFTCATHAENEIRSEYAKADVQPVKVERVANNRIRITYRIPPETLWYSGGVNYLAQNDVLKIAINKCPYNKSCNPMAVGHQSRSDFWAGDVTLPYRGERVLMVYSDVEELVYP